MLLFQIVCLIIGTGFFRCVSIFDIFPLGINYIGLTVVVASLIIFQVILNFEFFFFNFQTYLESSVSISYFSWLNDLLWLLYLSLIISHATTKRRPSNQCTLCLEEKYQILKHSEKNPCLLFNKRFEIRACNHK